MKKFKVLKPLTLDGTDYAVDAVIELDEETAAALIAEGAVEEFVDPGAAGDTGSTDDGTTRTATPPASQQTRSAKHTFKVRSSSSSPAQTRSTTASTTVAPSLVRTMMTVRQERAAADFAATEITDVLGLISGGNVIFPLTTRMPVRGNLNIIYADWSDGNPAIGLVDECSADDNEVDMSHYTAIPGKYKATVPICSEYLEDNASMDAFVRAALSRATGIGMDVGIMQGAFTNSKGFRGIIGDTDRAATAVVGNTSTAMTKAQLDALIAKVHSGLLDNLTLAFNPLAWQAFVSGINPQNTCCGDIVTGKNPSYRGWPVKLTIAVPAATKVVAGDFSHYVVGVRRAVTVESDKSAGFAEDAVLFKVTTRLCGGIAISKDADGYAGFAYGVAS